MFLRPNRQDSEDENGGVPIKRPYSGSSAHSSTRLRRIKLPSHTQKLLTNSAANVINAGSNAVLLLIVPMFLVRLLSRDEYAAWALVLQLAAFVNYFRFGMDTAVGKYIAEAIATADRTREHRILNAAVAILSGCAILGVALTVVLAANMPRWFRHIPYALQHKSQITTLMIGTAMSTGLLTISMGGYLTGIQRYDILAAINISGRLLAGVLIVCVAWRHGGLIALGIAWCVGLTITYGGLVIGTLRHATHLCVHWSYMCTTELRSLLSYCASLTVWAVGMLMVNGLDSVFVGHFDFISVGYYTIAANAISLLAGLQGALFAPLVPLTSSLNMHDDTRREIPHILLRSTKYCLYALVLTGMPLLVFARPILAVWVGSNYAVHTAEFLQILVVGNFIRLLATPYAVILIGTGEQRKALITPLVEGIINVSASLWLGHKLGAIGVAWGTLIGAISGFTCNLLYNMVRTPLISPCIRRYITKGLVAPFAATVPLLLLLAFISISHSWMLRVILVVTGGPVSVWLFLMTGLEPAERWKLLQSAMSLRRRFV